MGWDKDTDSLIYCDSLFTIVLIALSVPESIFYLDFKLSTYINKTYTNNMLRELNTKTEKGDKTMLHLFQKSQ